MLSLPAGTEMFHFPALPPAALCIQAGATPHDEGRVSPFGNPRITAWLPAPRGISQAPASFIGSWYQGIHRVPLKTWLHIATTKYAEEPPAPKGTRELQEYRCSRPLCSSQETDSTTGPPPHPRKTAMACTEDPGKSPFPQDPTACPPGTRPASPVPRPAGARTDWEKEKDPGE